MNGRVSKALRRAIYRGGDFRKREYRHMSVRLELSDWKRTLCRWIGQYLNRKLAIFLAQKLGRIIPIGQMVAIGHRAAYQKAKKEYKYLRNIGVRPTL